MTSISAPLKHCGSGCCSAACCQQHPGCCLRCRENAEAIAFYGGDVREASDLSSRLVVVLDVLLRRIAWLGGYELWLVVYRWVVGQEPLGTAS